jgi:type II secretory pathway component PulF
MRKLPNFFDEQEIAIVESGEQTGMLQESFLAIANDLRSQDELRNKITSAMTYPVIIMFFLMLAVTVVMTYVIPQLLPILTGMSGELPLMTKALIGTSQFIRNNLFLIIFSFIAIGLIWTGYVRTDIGALTWDKEKITLPIV